MNLKEGTRRLALLLGVVGALGGGFLSYLELDDTISKRALHNRFEQLANSDVVVQERKSHAGWYTIDPQSGERMDWTQQVGKGGIKTIHWTPDLKVAYIEAEEGPTLYPTPAPAAWQYLFIVFCPILGFLIPWGVIRAIGWVVAGFVKSSV